MNALITMLTLLRNAAVLVLLYFAAWLTIMGTRFLVPAVHFLVPHFVGRYSIGVAEFVLALLPALVVGLLASVAFVGSRRSLWVWLLALFLFLQGVLGVGPLSVDDSAKTWLIMAVLEFSPFLLVGIVATVAQRRPNRHATRSAA